MTVFPTLRQVSNQAKTLFSCPITAFWGKAVMGQSGNQGFYLPPVLSMLRTLVGLEILLDFKTVSDPRAAIGLEANPHKKSQR